MTARILSVVNEKGGTGKTTTTINLAVALQARGLKVLVINLDPAEKALMTFTSLRTKNPLPMAVRERELQPMIAEVSELFDWVLIDNAPTMSKLTGESVACSDICLLPVKPSTLDVSVSDKTVQVVEASIKNSGKPKAFFLITQQIKGSIPAREIAGKLASYNLPILKSRTSHLVDYIKTLDLGKGVTELPKSSIARAEIEAILEELLAC